jgi:redox-sensitive bicupin YhaK (pirin superfamily)
MTTQQRTATHYKMLKALDLYYPPASNYHPANLYFQFSFANYHNPKNINLGALRVLNDDGTKPHSRFGEHPHKDMEIVSYIVKGELSHLGGATNVKGLLKHSHVQSVTAGNGVWHY